MASGQHQAVDILFFWWQVGPERWFSTNAAFDRQVADQFMAMYHHAAAGGLDHWEATPHGALALLILLDQFPRNMFRDTPRAFATDSKALALSGQTVARRDHLAYPTTARQFFFLPFEHAEDMEAQTIAVDCFRKYGDEQGYFYALLHMDVIRRFGRFPHRNKILGRKSTAAEEAFLQEGGLLT
ncbi:MAG: DUF924 domain-containing protein [Synechococcus sp. SB0663_bin_10]|nr:DUF924 domain-containing protein [Synechococcus sp. SB0663_bin_10]